MQEKPKVSLGLMIKDEAWGVCDVFPAISALSPLHGRSDEALLLKSHADVLGVRLRREYSRRRGVTITWCY